MDESSSSAIHTIVHVLKSIWSLNWTRYLSWITATFAFPLRMAWIPLSYVLAVLKAVFAPAGYILAYFGGWVSAIARFLVSLEVTMS